MRKEGIHGEDRECGLCLENQGGKPDSRFSKKRIFNQRHRVYESYIVQPHSLICVYTHIHNLEGILF